MKLKKRLIEGVAIGLIGAVAYLGVSKLEDKLWNEIKESLNPLRDFIERTPREEYKDNIRGSYNIPSYPNYSNNYYLVILSI